ncbi:MAG TPA: sulfite exporter TauE/SafE family protein [Devosiaceae bacterium]
MNEIILLLAGAVAGVINTLAGGGSFVMFPALLLVGVPPVLANASNTYAALPGYVGGAVGFWSDIARHRRQLPLYIAISAVGGYLGAELLLHVSDAQFEAVVPWLMAFAVVSFAFGGRFNTWLAGRAEGRHGLRRAGAIGLTLLLVLVCVYGGFFNAGLGIIILAYLALAGFTDIHAMNGLKLLISAIVAFIAVARFAISGDIAWYDGTIALIGTTIGGYAAARVAHLIPTPALRGAILIYSIGLTAFFFWKTYA